MKDLYNLTLTDIEKAASEEFINKICAEIEPTEEVPDSVIEALFPGAAHFGALRSMLGRYLAVTGSMYITHLPATCIFCADHGVAAENVSAYPPETTLHMTTNYVISKGAAANAFSNFIHSEMLVADMGIKGDTSTLPNLLQLKIADGTQNSAHGPAMSRAEALKALCSGIIIAQRLAKAGCTIFLPGEMGISNTTSSAAITAAICHLPAQATTGRGTNISDARLQKKIEIVQQILSVNNTNPNDGIEVLAHLGGFELGAIAGLIIGAASQRALTVLDGFNTGAAALIASTICPAVKDYLLASHLGGESGHPHILQKLGLQPIMTLDIKLGEAIGSSLAADLLIKSILSCAECSEDERNTRLQLLTHRHITAKKIQLTDKTFDFYTNTMPPLDRLSMEKCQLRLDNLAKPIYCLGTMEKLLVQLSGILGEELPDTNMAKALLLIGLEKDAEDDENPEAVQKPYTTQQAVTISSFAQGSGTDVTIAHLGANCTQMDAFEFGRKEGEYLALNNGIVGLGIVDKDTEAISRIADTLLNIDGSLRFDTTSFLNSLSNRHQILASAMLGAMIAAAHNDSMIILDDAATVAIASYAVAMLPDLKDFLLPVQPQLYQLNTTAPGIAALTGISLLTASLHALNDMKTFNEAQVAVANDGPGKGKQNQ